MKKNLYLLFLLMFNIFTKAQTYVDIAQFGEFKNAASFSINSAGFFYISDSQTNEVIKTDSLGNILKVIGGFGWTENTFDNPADISANILSVYVADKNNNRIQVFDKDLNFVSAFSNYDNGNEKTQFKYPTAVAVSNQGDIYILDSDNKRVLKYNMKGDFLASIGGIDSGNYQLTDPKKICIDSFEDLLILNSNSIVAYDLFGNNLSKINLPFEAASINSFRNLILVSNNNSFMVLRNSGAGKFEIETNLRQLNLNDEIVETNFFNNKLYVLTKSAIHVFAK